MLADLLDKLAQRNRSPRTTGRSALDDALADARDVLTTAATEAHPVGAWSPADPLRLTKDRVHWLLHCPRRAVTRSDGPSGRIEDLLLGLVVDAGAKLLALGGARPVTAEASVAFLDAQGDDRVSAHLAGLDEPDATLLRHEADLRLGQLEALWPDVEAPWWPRVEEPVRVPLADRSILLSGNLDILLGGPPTGRPGVIVEIKGGRWHHNARTETHFYGLLLGLRDGVAPTHVVSLAAGEAATHIEEVRPAILNNVAWQVATALETAASIAAGEVPAAHPGSQCATCPVRTGCPAGGELETDRVAA